MAEVPTSHPKRYSKLFQKGHRKETNLRRVPGKVSCWQKKNDCEKKSTRLESYREKRLVFTYRFSFSADFPTGLLFRNKFSPSLSHFLFSPWLSTPIPVASIKVRRFIGWATLALLAFLCLAEILSVHKRPPILSTTASIAQKTPEKCASEREWVS